MASPQLFEKNDVVFISPVGGHYGNREDDGNPGLVWGEIYDNEYVRWSNNRSNSYTFRERLVHARDLKVIYEPIAKSLAELLATKKVISFRYSYNNNVFNYFNYGSWYEIVSIRDRIITTPTYRDIPALSINIPNIELRRLPYTDIPGNSVSSESSTRTIDVLQLLRSNYTLYSEEESKEILTKIEEERKKLLEKRNKVVEKFSKSMIETFGEEYVDIRESNGCVEFITHFPELTISNSEGRSHRIVDLYTKFVIKEDGKFSGLYGIRSTRTYAEVNSAYHHSHISSASGRKDWSSFCLGDSTPIKMLITEFSTDINSYTEENIDMFCYQLNNYVRWESIEGKPYMYIRDITSRNRVGEIRNNKSLEDAYNKYTLLYKDFPFEVINSKISDSIKVTLTDELEQRITKVASEFVYKIGGQYYSDERDIIDPSLKIQIGEYMFTFKGKEIKYNINSGDDQKEAKAQKVAHPKISEYVTNRLSEQFELFLSEEKC